MQLHIWVAHLLECWSDFLNNTSVFSATFERNIPERSAFSGSERLWGTVNQTQDEFWRTCVGNLWLKNLMQAIDWLRVLPLELSLWLFMGNRGWVGIIQPALNGMAYFRKRNLVQRTCSFLRSLWWDHFTHLCTKDLAWVWWHLKLYELGWVVESVADRMQAKKILLGGFLVFSMCAKKDREVFLVLTRERAR